MEYNKNKKQFKKPLSISKNKQPNSSFTLNNDSDDSDTIEIIDENDKSNEVAKTFNNEDDSDDSNLGEAEDSNCTPFYSPTKTNILVRKNQKFKQDYKYKFNFSSVINKPILNVCFNSNSNQYKAEINAAHIEDNNSFTQDENISHNFEPKKDKRKLTENKFFINKVSPKITTNKKQKTSNHNGLSNK